MALVTNLSIADFLACCTKLLYYFFQMLDSTAAKFLYEVFGRIVGQASFLTILSISIDRFLLVVFPIKHRCWIKSAGSLVIADMAFIHSKDSSLARNKIPRNYCMKA